MKKTILVCDFCGCECSKDSASEFKIKKRDSFIYYDGMTGEPYRHFFWKRVDICGACLEEIKHGLFEK